jgi:hypothetical protein
MGFDCDEMKRRRGMVEMLLDVCGRCDVQVR